MTMRILLVFTSEATAVISAVLEALDGREPAQGFPKRSRWRLAGLLGRPVPPGMKLEGSLWSYSSWEGGSRCSGRS